MWAAGREIEQFKCFGDVVTFDTTYRINLYDIPFGLLLVLIITFRASYTEAC